MEESSFHTNLKKKNLFPKVLAASLALVSQLPVNSCALSKNDSTKPQKKTSSIIKNGVKVAIPVAGLLIIGGLVRKHRNQNKNQFLQKFRDLTKDKTTLDDIKATFKLFLSKLNTHCTDKEKYKKIAKDRKLASEMVFLERKIIQKNTIPGTDDNDDIKLTQKDKKELCNAYEKYLKTIIDLVGGKNFEFEKIFDELNSDSYKQEYESIKERISSSYYG